MRRQHERSEVISPATISDGRRSLAATLKNISIGGVFLSTDVPFNVGADIEVVLILPKELGLQSEKLVACYGRVVRVESTEGRYGIAAQIEGIAELPQGRDSSVV